MKYFTSMILLITPLVAGDNATELEYVTCVEPEKRSSTQIESPEVVLIRSSRRVFKPYKGTYVDITEQWWKQSQAEDARKGLDVGKRWYILWGRQSAVERVLKEGVAKIAEMPSEELLAILKEYPSKDVGDPFADAIRVMPQISIQSDKESLVWVSILVNHSVEGGPYPGTSRVVNIVAARLALDNGVYVASRADDVMLDGLRKAISNDKLKQSVVGGSHAGPMFASLSSVRKHSTVQALVSPVGIFVGDGYATLADQVTTALRSNREFTAHFEAASLGRLSKCTIVYDVDGYDEPLIMLTLPDRVVTRPQDERREQELNGCP